MILDHGTLVLLAINTVLPRRSSHASSTLGPWSRESCPQSQQFTDRTLGPEWAPVAPPHTAGN